MADLIISGDDLSEKLEKFTLKCNECNSINVKIDIDWASYPSCSWLNVNLICEICKKEEEIYSDST